ncbi:methyltransferase [Cyclospora cayetanensis]|uniref:Methyltransferase n=1 Tax=Cyclospora cayetanensis TaxID=88456 RepID=A0A1D3CY99_9EIME|nr:methyltransferase [Cyclospora cayetanensis]
MSRPEYSLPADVYYGEEESLRYARSSRMHTVQQQLAERALEMLLLPDDQSCLVLDLGFGCGMSGAVVSEKGHFVVGLDISRSMLEQADELENYNNADAIEADLGRPFYFRPGTFDGAISISAIQWLCSDIKSDFGKAISTRGAEAKAEEEIQEAMGVARIQYCHMEARLHMHDIRVCVEIDDALCC